MIDDIKKVFAEREKQRKAQQFAAWWADLESVPASWKPQLEDGYVADVELQPHWWLGEGPSLIRCRHVDSEVQLMDGITGPALNSHLPYPVFLAAAETFLKGMYLCHYSECRQIAPDDYVPPDRRTKYFKIVKGFGHHLPKLIEANSSVEEYRTDAQCMRFLRILDALVRRFDFPLQAAEEGHGWATARYPKRFYNDKTKQGASDSYKSFPQQEFVAHLFKDMSDHLEKKWKLRRDFLEKRKANRDKAETKAAVR